MMSTHERGRPSSECSAQQARRAALLALAFVSVLFARSPHSSPLTPIPVHTMGKPFLSRHSLSEQASCLASVPFAAAGAADEDGVATTHNLLALGTWSEDTQVRHQAAERHRLLAIAGGST
jgi:hypothetical protein